MEQVVLTAKNCYSGLTDHIRKNQMQRILLVCGRFLPLLPIHIYLADLEKSGVQLVQFSDFQPNPLFESVIKGIEVFHHEQCDSIIAIGGGSAIDVAKCIKLYANMESGGNYLTQFVIPNQIPLIAIPTTAGTGSESTRFAVVYVNGGKAFCHKRKLSPFCHTVGCFRFADAAGLSEKIFYDGCFMPCG